MDEDALIEKLLKIEALYAGATSAGERSAAANARERIMERLAAFDRVETPVEYQLSLHDPWARRVFVALARRYGLRPFRYPRQRTTTVMIKVAPSFFDNTLWPEFEALSGELRVYLDEITKRVIATAIHGDTSDAADDGKPPLPE
jgi:hypothetical protein